MTPSREGDSDDPTPDVPLDHKDNVDRDAAFGGHTARSAARSRRNRSPHVARPRGSAHVARCGVRTRRKAQGAFTGRHSPILIPVSGCVSHGLGAATPLNPCATSNLLHSSGRFKSRAIRHIVLPVPTFSPHFSPLWPWGQKEFCHAEGGF